MQKELITFSNLEWFIINKTSKEKLLLLRECLTNEQIAKYFIEKAMVVYYDVKFNDKKSPWWDESYIQRILNTNFLSDLNINALNKMKTTLELNGEIRTAENYVRLLTYEEANCLPLEIRKTKRCWGYWTMSPYNLNNSTTRVFRVNGSGTCAPGRLGGSHCAYGTAAVLPVVSLKSDTLEKQESNLITEDIEEEFRKALRM